MNGSDMAMRLRMALMFQFASTALGGALLAITTTAYASSQGSGFLVSAPDLAVTAFHVVDGADDIQVRTATGATRPAIVVAADTENDIAVLRLQGEFLNIPALSIRSSGSVKKGQGILALGYPLSSVQGREVKATDGIISSLSGLGGAQSHMQVSAPIQPGSSGGPLLDRVGNVIGVVIATMDPIKTLRATGAIPQNVNFAIKSDYVLRLLRDNGIIAATASKQSSQRTEDIVAAVEPSVLQIVARNSVKEREDALNAHREELTRTQQQAARAALQREEEEMARKRQQAAEKRRALESELSGLAQQDAMLASQEQALVSVINQANSIRSPLGSGIVDPVAYSAYLQALDRARQAQRQLPQLSAQRAGVRSRYSEVSRQLQQLEY